METYWKVNEVAAAIRVSEQTVYRYVAKGEIPYHKLSRAAVQAFRNRKLDGKQEGGVGEA